MLGGAVIADTTRAHRVLETSHPPVYYVPLEDVAPGSLEPSSGRATVCEWKGIASYFDVIGGDGRRVERAAWTYPDPAPAFETIRDAVAFYPGPWTNAHSTASSSKRSPAASTAAGSRAISSARSRAAPVPRLVGTTAKSF